QRRSCRTVYAGLTVEYNRLCSPLYFYGSMLRIALKIVLNQPLHIGAGDRDKMLSLARDALGRPCIPASTVKGAHRTATEQFATSLGLRVCAPPLASQMCQPTG